MKKYEPNITIIWRLGASFVINRNPRTSWIAKLPSFNGYGCKLYTNTDTGFLKFEYSVYDISVICLLGLLLTARRPKARAGKRTDLNVPVIHLPERWLVEPTRTRHNLETLS